MGPLLVDEDWHAVLSSHPHGRRRSGIGELVLQVRDDEQGSQRPPSKWKHQCKTLWTMRHARERCDAYYDQTSEHKIVNRDAVRRELWNKHLQSAALALAEELRRVEV